MPTISREFHAHSGNYTPGGNAPRYIVVHYTANTANARQEATYAATSQHPSSYHFVLDGGGTIYQLLDATDTAWAVGAWAGATQLIGNDESVSIEVCNDGRQFTTDEVAELRWLVRKLMRELGIDADHVVRHFDCHTGRKDCPLYYAGFGNAAWETLRDTITRGELMTPQDVWNQEIATKEGNKPAWTCLSWAWAYSKDMQPKVTDTRNKVIELEKKVDNLTAQLKTANKTLNAIVKKLA